MKLEVEPILVSAEVDEVLINKGKAIGVQMKDGKQILAKNIISNAGLITTYNKLLPTSIVKKYQLKKHLQTVNPSVAHVSLYIGLEGTPEELQIPKTNYWVYPAKEDHDTCVHNYLEDLSKPFPVVYMSFPAAKDPDWKNRYPDKSAIDIITLVPYEMFEKWKETSWKKRGDDYEEIKEQIAQRLLKELYKQLPQVEGKIKHYELSSPAYN